MPFVGMELVADGVCRSHQLRGKRAVVFGLNRDAPWGFCLFTVVLFASYRCDFTIARVLSRLLNGYTCVPILDRTRPAMPGTSNKHARTVVTVRARQYYFAPGHIHFLHLGVFGLKFGVLLGLLRPFLFHLQNEKKKWTV